MQVFAFVLLASVVSLLATRLLQASLLAYTSAQPPMGLKLWWVHECALRGSPVSSTFPQRSLLYQRVANPFSPQRPGHFSRASPRVTNHMQPMASSIKAGATQKMVL